VAALTGRGCEPAPQHKASPSGAASTTTETRDMLKGVYPILATCFDADGAIDYGSQKRLIEFCLDGGAHGLVMLANASEGHLLSEEEKRSLTEFGLREVAGRAPVIVTVNHPSASAASSMAVFARDLGASAAMMLPPFFGRWRPGLDEIRRYFEILDAVGLPLVVQDHALSDLNLPVPFLVELANSVPHVEYLKLESGNIIHKARRLLATSGDGLKGVFGGNSGVFLPEEYDAGCRGTMPACYMPDVFRKTWDLLQSGDRDEALDYFAPFSRLAAYEKDVCNRCVWKELLVARGIIACGAVREPRPAFADNWQIEQLMEVARSCGLIG
jgi:2-keto-3-deoxy-L-arabinonate dehydratase